MLKGKQLAVAVVAAATLASFAPLSAFADSRHSNETRGGYDQRDDSWRDRDRGNNNGDYRHNDNNGSRRNVTVQGRVSSVRHERDGYRVELDRGRDSYFIPEAAYRSWRGRSRGGIDLRIGVNIRIGGYYDPRGYVYVDTMDDYYDDGNYRDGGYRDGSYGYDRSVRGYVERVDFRRSVVLLREERSGRVITVDMPRSYDRRGVDLNDLRRGDLVTISGDWARGGVFEGYRIEGVRSGRY